MKTQKKLLFICILLVNITFGWSQVLCEECSDCKEEEEIENVENTEETEDIDYKLNVGEENEDMFLDEADMLGEELGEEIAEEVAEEVVVDVTSEAVVEVAAIAATSFLDVIPVVGEILQALAIVALSGYFLYELSKDTSANRRKHELALVRHRAEELEHKSWSPLFPSFSININDLESKRDTVSFIINTAKYIGEEQLKDYLDENNIKCEVAYDDSGINQSISLSKEPLIDFTPCAFETYSHPYTAGIENDSYKDEYRWTIPDINLFVENGKIKTSVKSVWITDFINKFKYVEKKDTSEYERDYTAANNNIVELMLAKVTNKGFKEIGSIPYTAKDNDNGIITIRVNNFDLSNFDEEEYWVLVKVTGHETYAHIYEFLDINKNPVGNTNYLGYTPSYIKTKKARQKFIELEKVGNFDQIIPNFDADDGFSASDHPYIRQAKMSPSFYSGVPIPFDPPFVFPLASQRKTLFYAQLRDFQPHDTKETAVDKEASEINIFPTLKAISADFGSPQGEQLKISENGENHFLLALDSYEGAKEVSYIELISLSLEKNIICKLNVTHAESGATKSLVLNATAHGVNEINKPIKVNAVREDLLGAQYLSDDSSHNILHGITTEWVLQNLPLSAGEKVYLTVHYEDETLSKKLISIPSLSTPFKRAYFTIKAPNEGGNNFLSTSKNEYGETILILNEGQNIADNEENQWLIEHYGGNQYTFMNRKSKKVLAIKNGTLGAYYWDPYDLDQFWNVNFLKGDIVRLMSVGSSTFISGDINGIYHSPEGDEIHFKVDYKEDAEAILSNEERLITSREGSRYLSNRTGISVFNPELCNFDQTSKHRIRMLYQGNLHYTIENINEDIDDGTERTFALHSDREYHNGKLSWNNRTTTPWLYTKIDENYFALSSKNNWIETVFDESKKCDNVLSEVYDANIPTDDYSKHFSFSSAIYPDYSDCKVKTENTDFEWIKEITIGNYSNATGDSKSKNNNGVYNFENWNFTVGESYDFGISLGINYLDPRFYKVSMDLNRNGIFESNEVLFSDNSLISEDTLFLHSNSIHIPEDVLPGPIRVRVALGYNSYPEDCESYQDGEVEDYIVTIIPKIDYSHCTPENNDTGWEWIDSFSVGPYTNSSGNNDGYAFFDNDPLWYFDINGQDYDVSATIKVIDSYYEDLRIWIDLDQSGYFEDTELVYSITEFITYPNETISGGKIHIPGGVNTKPGKTRMRVTMKYQNGASGCEDGLYGEVEDYTIYLVPNPLHQSSVYSSTAQKTAINNTQNSTQNLNSTAPLDEDIFTLYPNPADDNVIFNFTLNSDSSSDGGIIIYNILGKVVKRLDKTFIKGNNEFNVNVKNLSSGVYFVRLYQNTNSKILRKRLIIE